MKKIISVEPSNLGWLEVLLDDSEMSFLWRCIENQGQSVKKDLSGILSKSNTLVDKDDWLFTKTLLPLCDVYSKSFKNLGNDIPINKTSPYYLSNMWVNYQKQHEFNPDHIHDGVYSFVIWMQIPTKHSEQNKLDFAISSDMKRVSSFQFKYSNILGNHQEHIYEMNPNIAGTMLFFPSKLTHSVNPFYQCNLDRISISGNISLNVLKGDAV